MTVTEHTDPVAAAESLMLELFQHVFQNDAARRHFGFSQISQVVDADGLPQWYLWFSDKRGAYSLTIVEGCTLSDSFDAAAHGSGAPLVESRILLRYFPAIEEDDFDALSCTEQLFRMSPNCDATGTPSFEGGGAMHPSFFVAGHMDIIVDSSKRDVAFFCAAPDRWRDYRTDGLIMTDTTGTPQQVLSPGDIDRDFPGWMLTSFFFDKIISAFCCMTAGAPRIAGAAMKRSRHYEIDGANHVTVVDDDTIMERILGAAFFDADDEETVRKKAASFTERLNSRDYGLIGIWERPDDIPAGWCNPAWWTIRDRHFHADSDRLCSCYHDH